MYQSLYRKYRPKSFNEVVGQTVIVQTLKNSVKKNKLSHAYLFAGPRGTGKTSIAKILAKTINCENLIDANPCNKCVNCTQINNKQFVDIIEIDAASNNGVDEIREINNKVNLVPSMGKYKVYIIDEVHMLTTGAFNALLKTLEEPPSHIIFILATTEPHKIPATILSRCQRFDFKKISQIEMKKRIDQIVKEENIKIEEEAIDEISILSDGGMRDALSMLDQAIAYSDDNITIQDIHEINGTITNNELGDFIYKLMNNNTKEILNKIDELDIKGKDFVKLTEEIILFLRNLLISKMINESNDETILELKELMNADQIMNYIKKFNSILNEMKNSNHPRIIFEVLMIQLLDKTKQNSEEPIRKPKIDDSLNKTPKIENKKLDDSKIEQVIENNQANIINSMKKIRINNTLCQLDKNKAILIKQKLQEMNNTLILDEYAIYYSMLLEGKLTAYGNNTLIFVFGTEGLSNEFNQNIEEIEKMLKKYLNEDCKVIATYQQEWNNIKIEYAKNKNQYHYIEEPKLTTKKQENSIEQEFENIIEYS
mgnify:FL=1